MKALVVTLMVGCASEPETGLEITHASSDGVSGWYRTDDAVVGFETVRDANGELAARYFDASGWSVVEGIGDAPDVFAAHAPTEQQVETGVAAHERSAMLVGEAAAALATADLPIAERDALVELGGLSAERSDGVANYTGTLGTFAVCSRSVREWTRVAIENDSNLTRGRRLTFWFTRSSDGYRYSNYIDVSVPPYTITSRLKVSLAGHDMTAVTVPGLGSVTKVYAWIAFNSCAP